MIVVPLMAHEIHEYFLRDFFVCFMNCMVIGRVPHRLEDKIISQISRLLAKS